MDTDIIEAMARAVMDAADDAEDEPLTAVEFCTVARDAARAFQIHEQVKTGACPTCGKRDKPLTGAERQRRYRERRKAEK